MKTSFDLTLFDDWETERNLKFLNRLQTLFAHTKNTLPNEYYQFSDNLPIGSKVRVTFEVIEE